MAHSCVWHHSDSGRGREVLLPHPLWSCMTWLIQMCDMTNFDMRYGAFTCVIWLRESCCYLTLYVHMCNMTLSCVWHDWFLRDMAHAWVWQHFFWWVLQHCTGFARLVWGRLRVHRAFIYSDWFVCDMTGFYETWPMPMCDNICVATMCYNICVTTMRDNICVTTVCDNYVWQLTMWQLCVATMCDN